MDFLEAWEQERKVPIQMMNFVLMIMKFVL